MLLYDTARPNPRAVHMALLEKRITVPSHDVDVDGGANRRPDFLAHNPGGQVPVLVLDDGTWLAESGAIFQYLEERSPDPPLIGRTPEKRAVTRMWQRRIEQRITEPFYAAFHYGPAVEMYRSRMVMLVDCADGFKALVRDGMAWLDSLLAGAITVVPQRFTIADITLFAALDFSASIGWPIPAGLRHLERWFRATAERPSARASSHPKSSQTGVHY